jgi:hypothetical protein
MMPRALEVLKLMIELEELGHEPDLVREGRAVWLGCERLSNRTLDSLIMHVALASTSDEGSSVERYEVNSTGRAIARRPELADEVLGAVMAHRAFTIREDRVVYL